MGLTRIAAGSYESTAVKDSIELGEHLGRVVAAGDVIVLTGDLGAGKTQLTKGVAAAMGIKGEVTSPTFTIGMSYEGVSCDLHHFDLYRLDDASQLEDTGILDLAGGDGVCIVEWGEAYADDLGSDRLEISITRKTLDDAEPLRHFACKATGSRSRALLAALDESLQE